MFSRVFLLCATALSAQAAGVLTIVNPAIQQGEGGAPTPPGFTHVSGEVIYFSFQVENYQVSPAQKILLTTRVQAFDPRGAPIIEPIAAKIEAELAPEDKTWKPKMGHEVSIPPLAGSGIYKIAVEVTDELAKTKATREVTFEVRGHEVAPSETLVIRNFHFYRAEDATDPLAQAAYRPGDAVWARFDIIGYKFGPGNAIDVSYRVTVLAPSGKVLWSEPEDQVVPEKGQSFYAKRYVPGSMSLNLQPNIRPGDYGLVISARDSIGSQTFESKQTFTVQ